MSPIISPPGPERIQLLVWLRHPWRTLSVWYANWAASMEFLATAMDTRNSPATATIPRPTALLPLIVKCSACPETVFSTVVDDHGRCVSCSAVTAALEMVRIAEQDEVDRAAREQEAAVLAAAEHRGAGSPPRLPDEPAPTVPFAAHAQDVLPRMILEEQSETGPVLDYVALGYVAVATDDDDATLRAQIMMADRHDAPGLMAGISAGLSAFTARQEYAAHLAAQKDLVSA